MAEVHNRAGSRFRAFLGLEPNLVLVLTANFVIAAGEETWVRFVPKYLDALGASVAVIGSYDAIRTILGALYAYPGGALSDRWGGRRALIFFHLLSIAGYGVMLLWVHWAAVLTGSILFLAWSTLSLPALFSMVAAHLPPSKHGMGIAVQSIIRRVPVLIAPLVGGILMDRLGLVSGVRAGLIISIACGLGSVALQFRITETPPERQPALGPFLQILRSFSPPLRRLLVADILVRFCERLPFAWVVIYAMNHLYATATEVGILLAIEMLVAIATYIPVAHFSDRYGREPFVVATFVFFTLFPLSLWLSTGFGTLALAFAIRGLKEFGDPSRKALILQYAPSETRGRVVGAYYLVRDLTVSTGAVAGAVLWSYGPAANFLVAAAAGFLGTAMYTITLGRR